MTAVARRAGQGGAGRGRAGQVSARANLRGWTQQAAACQDQTGSNDFASLRASRIQRVSGRLGRRRAAEAAGGGGQGGPDAGQGRLG